MGPEWVSIIALVALFVIGTYHGRWLGFGTEHRFADSLVHPAFGLLTALVLLRVLTGTCPSWLRQPAVRWFGTISFGLYLWHYPIFEGSRLALENRLNPVAYQGLRFGAAFIVAAASFYWLEKPFLKLKQRYSEQLAARTYGVRHRPAPSGTDDLKRECCGVGGSQAPKISFATVTADIARGQPA